MIELIGLVGRAEAGKTTIARYLMAHHGFERTAFADPLKKMLITAGLATHDECYTKKTPESRRLMQLIGTEIFRKQVHPLFWVNKCEDEIVRLWDTTGKPVVADDIRFPEEAQRIKDMGGILVRVERIGHVNEQAGTTHESESQVNSIKVDTIIQAESGDIQKLYDGIEEVLRHNGKGGE